MRGTLFCLVTALAAALWNAAAWGAKVESFAPQGEVKGVRQVTARFSAPMVALGDPRLPAPFEIDCPVPGTSRWADPRHWVYDFEHDLPGGVRCTFTLRPDLAALDGEAVERAEPFAFSSGGPAILQTLPGEGATVDEEQIFILGLDASARKETVAANAFCDVQGVTERVPVELIEGEQRRTLLEARKDFIGRYLQSVRRGARSAGLPIDDERSPILALRCQRRLPNDAQVRLVWSAGIESQSGVATSQDQVIAWRVRESFEAKFSCQRATKDAHCLPILPMRLLFTAPVARSAAERIVLKGAGTVIRPSLPDAQAGGAYVEGVTFNGPFAERAQYTLELPSDLTDDAGRRLANQRRFPLTVRTDEHPPLAKFAGRFGIVELNGDGLLPVTLRNLEAMVEARTVKIGRQEDARAQSADRADQAINWLRKQLESARGEEGAVVPGAYSRIADGDVMAIVRWMRKLREFEHDRWRWDDKAQENIAEYRVGEKSIFGDQDKTRRIHVPKPQGARAFEVVGIALKRPGFYVVELASPRLGAALLGEKNKPYYVQAAALVTNLSVHLKWGRESSLVWVTALDSGKPVPKALVAVQDCAGKVYFRGETDALGRARIGALLPEPERLPACLENWDRQLVASARLGEDLGLVFSNWNEGIANWRFNLRSGSWQGPFIATTVFDRTLLRAGETVGMKHYYRRHTPKGFAYAPVDQLPKKALIQHVGSDEKYELALKWDARNIAESTWTIPAAAKKGVYHVLMTDTLDTRPGRGPATRLSGTFRVEEFRVPLMKAQLSGPKQPQVRAQAVDLDLHLRYLAGGAASGAPVKVRGVVRPRAVSFPAFEGFVFANGRVAPGIERTPSEWDAIDFESVEVDEEEPVAAPRDGARPLRAQSLQLDAAGSARVRLGGLPPTDQPQELAAEMEYTDPNGEILTVATRVPLWPARLVVGIKPDAWARSKEQLKFQMVVLDLNGRPIKGHKLRAELYLRQPFAHRKRLVGGFYGFESGARIERIAGGCEGVSDARGRVFCTVAPQVSGNVIVLAQARDGAGNVAYANASAWIAGEGQWWFDVSSDDRIDVIAERKRYEPGESAQLQVRMPFREATALITVEREGVLDSYVQPLSGTSPVVRLPLKAHYAPNVFVSVLVVRGRLGDVKPTALVDLGKPAFRMGTTEVEVGWRAHELNVQVKPERDAYKVREKAKVALRVTQKAGGKPAAGAEVAVAVVDEGLLELLPNDSWKLLEAMMRPRGTEVQTSTASMQVVGKRHYGRKALAQGGGGGREAARELFDTLLLWKARVPVDAKGNATIEVPLNDSLTAFRVVAVADAGAGQFGTGQAKLHTTQDLQILSGLPPVVREGDRFEARFTLRNAAAREMNVNLVARMNNRLLPAADVMLKAGEAREVLWEVVVPAGPKSLDWEVSATERDAAGAASGDRLRASQRVAEAVPVATLHASLMQLEDSLAVLVVPPANALPARGGVRIGLRPRLGDELGAVREYMQRYAYTCLEQKISRAVALRDAELWSRAMKELPAYLDRDGLAKYFAQERLGSDTLTAYVLAIAHEAGWPVPDTARERMSAGLRGFIEGRVLRDSPLPTADLTIRKLAALEALSRSQPVDASLLSTIAIEPDLWPTSAVIDWYGALSRNQWPQRSQWLAQAEQILRSRLNFQGTTMGFATERSDYLWWLMVSGDVNANRVLLAFLDHEGWREDIPRLVRGTLNRQQQGRWNTTVANAWGVLAMEKFSARFEQDTVSGTTTATLAGETGVVDWSNNAQGGALDLGWPRTEGGLTITHEGGGKPWVTVQSRAAVPLAAPQASGFQVKRTVSPVTTRQPGALSRGDTVRVRLEIEAQSDVTWVAVEDPLPAGATILGRGIGGDSQILASEDRGTGLVWPAFEERTFEAFRAYYRFVPKGAWAVEYTVRLNNAGRYQLPPTRVEAMYAPEMYAMVPNAPLTVGP
ncbi:MAG TPA: MG2 domain-containing protein [Burkholderiales bacterium]|nr:MG2 domain-containing protein [Burkholderiales bacterium]